MCGADVGHWATSSGSRMNPRRVSILLAFAPLVSYPAWTERSSDPLVIGACDAYKQSNAEYSTCLPGELQALEQ